MPLLLASWWFEAGPRVLTAIADMRWQIWACVLFMSYFATLFGLAMWNVLLHRYPTAVITPCADRTHDARLVLTRQRENVASAGHRWRRRWKGGARVEACHDLQGTVGRAGLNLRPTE